MGRHRAKKGGTAVRPDSPARRRTVSERGHETPPASPGKRPGGDAQRVRSQSEGDHVKSVRFNMDHALHVYPADPDVTLKPRSKRTRVPRRFDGPEWSIHKALKQRRRTLSEASGSSDDHVDSTPDSPSPTDAESNFLMVPNDTHRRRAPTPPPCRKLIDTPPPSKADAAGEHASCGDGGDEGDRLSTVATKAWSSTSHSATQHCMSTYDCVHRMLGEASIVSSPAFSTHEWLGVLVGVAVVIFACGATAKLAAGQVFFKPHPPLPMESHDNELSPWGAIGALLQRCDALLARRM